MPRHVLPFPQLPWLITKPTNDVGVVALPLLRKLCDRMAVAIDFARRVYSTFDGTVKSESRETATASSFADRPEAVVIARHRPDLAGAWAELHDLLDDVFTLAAADVHVRHAARAVPQLCTRLARIAPLHRRARKLADLLDVVDDEIVTVLVPDECRGWRLLVRGIADLGQFHTLFAHALTRTNPPPLGEAMTLKFQFMTPAALQADGLLPQAFAGNAHWCWEHQAFASMPRDRGERLLFAGPPAYPRQWMNQESATVASLEIRAAMTRAAVTDRLKSLGGAVTTTARIAA